jgi:hypothetical protein
MSGFFVLDVPEFSTLLAFAERCGKCRIHPKRGNYRFVEFEGTLEILREEAGMGEAVWYGCLTAGLDGEVSRFDSQRLVLEEAATRVGK